MASKRMIDINLINSDDFLSLESAAQSLYLQFIANADDDGFVGNPKAIMRMSGRKRKDLDELIEERFVICFDKCVVIRHWNVHNKIRKDRYQATRFKDEYDALELDESGVYEVKQSADNADILSDGDMDAASTPQVDGQSATNTPQADGQPATNTPTVDGVHAASTPHRLGRLGKVRLGSEGGREEGSATTTTSTTTTVKYGEIEKAWNAAADKNGMTKVKEASEWSTQRKNRIKSLVAKHGFDDVIATIEKAGNSDFLGGQNKRGWRCGIDWFSNAQNYLKIAEGNYTDEQQKVSDRFSGENDITAYL